MPAAPTQAEIEEIDAFILEEKTLDGPPPEWVPSSFPGELQATWGILDSLGIRVGALRFSCRVDRSEPSVSVTFRDKLIWRVDVVDQTICKPNPHGAAALGLSATICGSHHHAWPDNRRYVERHGFRRLPFRREMPAQVRRLSQALLALADEMSLTLDADQRGFDVPPTADLFGLQ